MIGLAFRPLGRLDDYSGYTWVGLLGLEDPVREGVVEAVEVARRAGIQVKMITGDYPKTAEHIARRTRPDAGGRKEPGRARMWRAWATRSCRHRCERPPCLPASVPTTSCASSRRCRPNGEITAMIGDGVNDAPALQRANIGVVVGSATDVAKETADLILLDNNFRTIVAAIEEGRIIFQNIRKVVAYTLSNSFAEVLAIFVAMILGWPAPLLVAQILWIHLICDGPSDIVLGFEPMEKGIMDEKPKSLHEPILNHLGLSLIGVISVSSATAVLFLFHHLYSAHGNAVEGRSIVFASFAINSMVYIFAYRSMRQPIWRMSPLSANMPLVWAVAAGVGMAVLPFLVPGLRSLLGIVPLSLAEWLEVAGIALGLLVVVEIGKWISNRVHAND